MHCLPNILYQNNLRGCALSNKLFLLRRQIAAHGGVFATYIFIYYINWSALGISNTKRKRITTNGVKNYDNFSLSVWGTKRAIPSSKYRYNLLARVANHSAEFDSSCTLAELAI